MDEAVLADLERELASPERRMAPEDRSPQQKIDILVSNSYLVQAVPDLVAEVRRLQGEHGTHRLRQRGDAVGRLRR